MWVFFTEGFVSIVAHRDKPVTMLVRARAREHLEAFVRASVQACWVAEVDIQHTPDADYEWRCEMFAYVVSSTVGHLAAMVDKDHVTNFKAHNKVSDPAWRDALHDVWGVCHDYQERAR